MRRTAVGRTLAIVLVGTLALTMAACASDEGDATAGGTAPDATAGTTPPIKADPAASVGPKVGSPEDPLNQDPVRPGATRQHFEIGPITVHPGQNNIEFKAAQVPHPTEDGWIVRISPNLRKEDGTVPPVDVIHLHHAVWLNLARQDPTSALPERIFAAGEEKSIATLPEGFGYRTEASDPWAMSYMIHNLFDFTEQIWITYDLDVIPADAPEAQGITEAYPIWMDIQNGSTYPVFDAHKGSGGDDDTFTYPDEDPNAYPAGPRLNEWVVDRDLTLISTAGHLHPGGLYTDLLLQRPGVTPSGAAAETAEGERARLFRSEFVYWEPAGAVSWDVAAKATPADWRVEIKAGDVLSTTAAYDVAEASWYESMGIMVVWAVEGVPGADPFTEKVAVEGAITHEHLPENDNHGGEEAGLPNALELPDGELVSDILVDDFLYYEGDTSEVDTDIPLVAEGDSIVFDNQEFDEGPGVWHTITACKAPCNQTTGIAFPLANADIQFDSGQLGYGGAPTAERNTWSTPNDLPTGTYTYFCRVHPFMRGAFRVITAPDAPTN